VSNPSGNDYVGMNLETTVGGGWGFMSQVLGPNTIALEGNGIVATNGASTTGIVATAYANGNITANALYGLWVNPAGLTNGASVTDNYGILVANQTVATNNYAIKTGAGKVQFGDTLQQFKGGNISSATTTALTGGNVFHITGTNTITTLNTCDSANAGRFVTLIFDGILTFTDGNNLKLAGNFVTSADDSISLVCDGSNWYETARSVN